MPATLKQTAAFLSPRRFTRNVLDRFPVPCVICIALWLLASIAFDPLFESVAESQLMLKHVLQRIGYGLIMALYFSTAASCLKCRLPLPRPAVWAVTAVGAVLGVIFGGTPTEQYLALASIVVCCVACCWTKHALVMALFLPIWFAGCFMLIFVLTFAGLYLFAFASIHSLYVLPRLWMFGMAYLLAPWLFLGALPLSDDEFQL